MHIHWNDHPRITYNVSRSQQRSLRLVNPFLLISYAMYGGRLVYTIDQYYYHLVLHSLILSVNTISDFRKSETRPTRRILFDFCEAKLLFSNKKHRDWFHRIKKMIFFDMFRMHLTMLFFASVNAGSRLISIRVSFRNCFNDYKR